MQQIHLPQNIEHLPTQTLIPYAANSRLHTPEQIQNVARSIQQFGFTNPVLIDHQNTIIAGHGRVMAAQQLQLKTIPCIRLTHLTEHQRKAYVIADNKLAEQSTWDLETLANEVQQLASENFDISLTGFSEEEFEQILQETKKELNREQLREAEKNTDSAPKTEAAFKKEMADPNPGAIAPIVPMYAEHHQAFIILCDNTIDEAWLRNRLQLEQPQQSYKDQKIQRANILTVNQLRQALQ